MRYKVCYNYAFFGRLYLRNSLIISCRARTRNYEDELKQEQLTKARTQIGTQVLQDPDLAKVATVWPTMASALKAAILAIVDSAKT